MPLPPELSDLDKLLTDANIENANGSERGCVMVWTSGLDEFLRRLLMAFMVDVGASKDLFEFTASAGSFSSRIELAYCLGLIAKDERDGCHAMRKLRNAFAHNLGISLAEPEHAATCKRLCEEFIGVMDFNTPRLQFGAAAARLTTLIWHRIPSAEASRREVLVDPLPPSHRGYGGVVPPPGGMNVSET